MYRTKSSLSPCGDDAAKEDAQAAKLSRTCMT